METKFYQLIAKTALLHNGVRYEQGESIELTEQEAENLTLYVQLDEAETARKAAEQKAKKAKQKTVEPDKTSDKTE
ncbi:hypothetical protein FW755_03200 [Lonepinella koalarum]|uniref:DUF7210 domain-containing protein n=1 Tax=Lonepinella koalarum TaxID=53417 RepID=A0A4R1KJD7_9PAST|nr:hypothetical protein [Lonepinella koalarum]MDH2927350.1 hypothetical protein [Lonepinella koalarum]TCK64918.1 hypothetical protein EV692_2403 [Lonepinella koalarum]TFJ88823.1 hypothetical protein E0709_11880 [Lonepinella koalarum]TYG34165.1 hypothetical protein FW755_03200 [Lonepinella koalarum]